MDYINAFWVGGLICAIAQIIIDKTKIMPARILVLYVILGAVLGGLGIYKYIENIGGAGATVPIIGFGNTLAKGVIKAVDEKGFIGIFTGGVTATSAGICAAVFFGMIISLFFKPKSK
ncbi:MAG: stage V sporulation protein AE [Ruminococcaceae bacterium]|nr:stage V sporulation protein AE [Oscillospiraceae bacterium]